MANCIKQFRYYSELTSSSLSGNVPSVNCIDYISGEAFDNYYPILQLGIQTIPGTRFYLNDSTEAIIVGSTGIYELDLGLNTKITKISFDSASMYKIRDNNNAYLIVDFMYDDGGIAPIEVEEEV